MIYPPSIRDKAVQLRVERRLSVNEIAERLAISKATIDGWVGDIPLQRPRMKPAIAAMAKTNKARYAALREAAYQVGLASWQRLSEVPTFRDFLMPFIAEGHKRTRHSVFVADSDPVVITLCTRWSRRLSTAPLRARSRYHADQDVEALRRFWGDLVDIEPAAIGAHRKPNRGRLKGRTWRCEYGMIQVGVHDTLLRAQMQAWANSIKADWG